MAKHSPHSNQGVTALDQAVAKRAFKAMMKMTKSDIAAIKAAQRGWGVTSVSATLKMVPRGHGSRFWFGKRHAQMPNNRAAFSPRIARR
jgi:hypothetical protein